MMAINFDKAVGLHASALLIQEKRSTLLASNVANADTPSYKSQDLNFKQALTQMTNTHSNSTQSSLNDLVQYRTPTQPDTGDGNTVDMQHEKMEFAKNSMDYQLSLSLLDGRIKSMMRAIRGE